MFQEKKYQNLLSPELAYSNRKHRESLESIDMDFGPIDGQNDDLNFIPMDPQQKNIGNNKIDPETTDNSADLSISGWKIKGSKLLDFALSSTTMFTYKGMEFQLHGFLVAMVAIDLALSTVFHPFEFYLRIPYVFFRNGLLFAAVLSCALLRIKFFATMHLMQNGGVAENLGFPMDDNEDEIDLELNANQPRRDSIFVKTVMVTYLGGLVELRSMSNEEKKQKLWFLFPALYHGALAFMCVIMAFRTKHDGGYHDEISFSNLYWWLAKSMFWCLAMTLLPVPGFDGAALLTLLLKGRGWNKLAIAFSLVFVAALVTFMCGIIGVFTIDILALYLAVFCGYRLCKYVFNPEDENMKVLRTMAKTTKQMSVADIVTP